MDGGVGGCGGGGLSGPGGPQPPIANKQNFTRRNAACCDTSLDDRHSHDSRRPSS